MRRKIGKLAGGLLLGALSVAVSPAAYAFLPAGGFDSFDTLRYRKFPVAEFDTNDNGNVDPGEGLEMYIETGPRGFSPNEIAGVKAGLQVWEDVPSSYASFGFIRETQDIINVGTTEPDFLSSISLQVGEGDIVEEGQEADTVNDLTDGLAGITLTIYTLDESILPTRGEAFIIPAGTIIDSDMVINAAAVRQVTPNEEVLEIEAVTAILTGLFLGLSFTPLNNLREIDIDADGTPEGFIESEVLGLTGVSGEQRRIGATPTMFPTYFQVDDFESNSFIGGASDLAPDDISGISFLYPQGSQANFFNVQQEARTHTRAGSSLPSTSISGGHIVAWADGDNDPSTPRVPLFNTITGLYINPKDEALWGRFDILGLWKQLEIPGTAGVFFTPSYTLSVNPFNSTGLERQAPGDFLPGNTASFFDSISGEDALTTVIGGAGGTKEYDENFPSEVYQENENVTDISNKDAGTPLVWNFERNQFISANTQKTLPELLPGSTPMFGDRNDICPLNVISGVPDGGTGGVTPPTTGSVIGIKSGTDTSGPNALRWIRDHVLLNSAPGTALVDAYYIASPKMAQLLLRYTNAIAPARAMMNAVYWLLGHGREVLALVVLGGLAAVVYRRRTASIGILLLLVLAAASVSAQIKFVTNEELAARADLIVKGEIKTVTPYWSPGGRIYTDYTILVTDTVKTPAAPEDPEGEGENPPPVDDDQPPHVAEGATIPFTVLGGTIGTVRMVASPLPTFQVGDSAVIHFIWKREKWIVLDGERGKVDVVSLTGKEVVRADSSISGIGLLEAAKKIPSAKVAQGENTAAPVIPLEDYLGYLRGLVESDAK